MGIQISELQHKRRFGVLFCCHRNSALLASLTSYVLMTTVPTSRPTQHDWTYPGSTKLPPAHLRLMKTPKPLHHNKASAPVSKAFESLCMCICVCVCVWGGGGVGGRGLCCVELCCVLHCVSNIPHSRGWLTWGHCGQCPSDARYSWPKLQTFYLSAWRCCCCSARLHSGSSHQQSLLGSWRFWSDCPPNRVFFSPGKLRRSGTTVSLLAPRFSKARLSTPCRWTVNNSLSVFRLVTLCQV